MDSPPNLTQEPISAIDPKSDLANYIKTMLPNSNRIVIRIEEKTKVTSEGIYRSQTNRGEDETLVGIVLAVGEGYFTEAGQFIETTSKVGDRVLIDKMGGVTIRVDRQGKILPFSEDITEDRLPIKIARQESVLWTFPPDWQP